MKGAIKGILMFLFIVIAVGGFLFGKPSSTSLENLVGKVNTTGNGTSLSDQSPFVTQLGITIGLSSIVGIAVGYLGGDLVLGVVSGIAGFFLGNIIPIIVDIFNDVNMPLEAKIIFGTLFIMMLGFGILEFFSGRKT